MCEFATFSPVKPSKRTDPHNAASINVAHLLKLLVCIDLDVGYLKIQISIGLNHYSG